MLNTSGIEIEHEDSWVPRHLTHGYIISFERMFGKGKWTRERIQYSEAHEQNEKGEIAEQLQQLIDEVKRVALAIFKIKEKPHFQDEETEKLEVFLNAFP